MPKTQIDRLEDIVAKIGTDVADMREVTFHQSEMMKITRDDVKSLYTKTETTDKDLLVLKTKATIFGSIAGVVSGAITAALGSMVKH